MINVTLFNDPGCPWGYCASPALRALEWRYGDQLDWRLVAIGLRDEVSDAMRDGFDPGVAASRYMVFRNRYGMPFGFEPKERAASTGRACRAIVAARLIEPGSEFGVLRALQLGNFTTSLLLDDDEQLREALRAVPGIDADAIVDRLDDVEVTAAYERDKAEARSAAGTAIETQGKGSTAEPGVVRFTAPSIVFEHEGHRLVAGGWQPDLAYDVCVANLDPTVSRAEPPETPGPLFDRFESGLTTAEVAALLAQGPDYIPDPDAAEQELVKLIADRSVVRMRLGDDSLWRPNGHRAGGRERAAVAAA
jgi:protein-disulfide isomerase-like protein with CxxC motif